MGIDDVIEVETSKRDAPPAHYTFKIESFSQLLEYLKRTELEKYESRDFEVAGYKWKLSLYPNGDKRRNGSEHISLYLVLSETNKIPLGGEVNVVFRLFAYDQIRDKYLMVQDASNKQVRLHALKRECGLSQFIPLDTFKDISNGYLIDDCCIFGVEVFVAKCTEKGESVTIKKPQKTITFTMENFWKLVDKEYRSSLDDIAGHRWCIIVYPNGNNNSKSKHLSIYLELDTDNWPEQKVWVDFKLRVKNHAGKHIEGEYYTWFNAERKNWGCPDFLLLSDLMNKLKGYIVNDTVIIEAEVIRVLTVKDFS